VLSDFPITASEAIRKLLTPLPSILKCFYNWY
jgi:hypothetical protein